MRNLTLLAGLFMLLFAAACATGPEIEIHPVPGADVGAYYTFEVVPDTTDSPLGPMRTREVRVRIEKILGEEMARLGYRQVENGADIQVEYVTYVTEEYQDLHEQKYRVAKAVLGEQELPEQSDVQLRTGTLHVHLLHDGRALYEGIASDVVNERISPERIRAAVRGLLGEVPNGPLMQEKPAD